MLNTRLSKAKSAMPLQWFEDSVAYCDICRELECAVHLFEQATLAHQKEGTWVKAVRCGDHGTLVAGRTALVLPSGVEFPTDIGGGTT